MWRPSSARTRRSGLLIIPDHFVPEGHEDDFEIVPPHGFAVAEEIDDDTWADFQA